MKKIALLLCLILVATILFGCGNKTTPPESGTTDGATTDAGTTENPYDENGYIRDSIPAGLNYGNETVRVMGWSNSEASYDFNTDYEKGDEIAEQTFSRNELVQERLKVVLEFNLNYNGGNADRT